VAEAAAAQATLQVLISSLCVGRDELNRRLASSRMMQGFGVHSFRFVNAAGASVFMTFHWNPVAGTHSVVDAEKRRR
jgi:Catalase